MLRRKGIRGPLLVLVLAGVAGCASATGPREPERPAKRWPAPPEPPRIEFVSEFSNSQDLGIRLSLWKKIISLAAGASLDALERPMAVVANASGSLIFVADPGRHCVHRFDLAEHRYDCLAETDGAALISPVGLALGPDGRLFVSDSTLAAIYELAPGAKRLRRFDVGAILEQPTGLVWSQEQRSLYVTDTLAQSVKLLDEQGVLTSEFGRRGQEQGELNYPTYLWQDRQGELLVTDSLNFRIQRFSGAGEFISSFGRPGNAVGYMARPKGVAVDEEGFVYVTDGMLHALQIFDPDGALMISIGSRGHGLGEFWLPVGVFIAGGNTIYVADSYNKRIQVFRYLGEAE